MTIPTGILYQLSTAILALGTWILFQAVIGIGTLGGAEDGVAYAAHIGGFPASLFLIKIFGRGQHQ